MNLLWNIMSNIALMVKILNLLMEIKNLKEISIKIRLNNNKLKDIMKYFFFEY